MVETEIDRGGVPSLNRNLIFHLTQVKVNSCEYITTKMYHHSTPITHPRPRQSHVATNYQNLDQCGYPLKIDPVLLADLVEMWTTILPLDTPLMEAMPPGCLVGPAMIPEPYPIQFQN